MICEAIGCAGVATVETRMRSQRVVRWCDLHWQVLARTRSQVEVLRWLDRPPFLAAKEVE
jgi:hypothetical protein